MEVIRVENIEKKFSAITLFKGLSFSINEGEIVALVGPSGSGKTTLLMIISGLIKPEKGKVFLLGMDMLRLRSSKLRKFLRENVGFIFQDYNLFPHLSVFRNIMMSALLTNRVKKEEIISLMEKTGIKELASRKVNYLSGGEKQRVGIVRAIAKMPRVILADEPTGNLDIESTLKVIDLLRTLCKEKKITALVATHDPLVVEKSDRYIELRR